MSKRIFASIIFLTLVFFNHSAQQATIKVGIYNNYPKVYVSDDGQAAGIFPEILDYIAAQEHWNIDYVQGNWNECLERLENGEIDIMVDVALSDERQAKYDFNRETVLLSWGCFYTRTRQNINSVLDLNGKTVAVMKNSILTNGEEGICRLKERYNVECSFIEVDDYYQVFELVRDGKADAGVVNRNFGSSFEDQYGLKKSNFIFNPTQLRFAFPKNTALSAELIEKLDTRLHELQKNTDSIYYTILAKYKLYPKKGIPVWLLPVIIGLVVLIIVFFIVNRTMKWRINRQTRMLQKTNAELKQEIVEHQRTLEKLEINRETYRNFVENIPGMVYMYDVDEAGKRIPLIRTSRNEEFLGKELAEIVKEDYNKFFDNIVKEDAQKLQEYSAEVERTGEIFNFEYRIRITKDTTKWFRSIGRVRKLEDGKTRWQGVILDINDRKKIEQELDIYREHLEQLVESRTEDLQSKTEELEKANISLKEADELKSIFLASMSHELRTPLNSIIGFTGILLMGMVGDLTEEQRKQLTIVKESANHLLELINDILDISKIEAGKVELSPEEFDINAVISELVKSIEPKAIEKGISLQRNLSGEIQQFSDLRRFKQIILNLLSNAVKFTEQGSVTIEARLVGDQIEISVQDTGIGIASKDICKLFEPFQQIDSSLTKKYDGTGLGLHLTKKIVELLKGKISVTSTAGKGTTFIVSMPINEEDNKDEKSTVN